MAAKTKVLLIGSTGYIGGSVLAAFLQDPASAARYEISAFIRRHEQIEKLKSVGVEGVWLRDIDDEKTIRDGARRCDVVIAAASARHAGCAKACIEGLSARKKDTGRAVHYIHTSGTSMLGDWPVSGERIDTAIYSDISDDIYAIEKNFPETHSPVRKVNQLVVALGEELRVKTYLVPAPLIFGPPPGILTTSYDTQVKTMIQQALELRKAIILGSGEGIWNRIHIRDLGSLFLTLVEKILYDPSADIPSGQTGYYFVENGFQSFKSIAQRTAQTGKALGVLDTDEVTSMGLQEFAERFYAGDVRLAESILASNSRTKADRARQVLGWEPKYGEDAFLNDIDGLVSELSGKTNA